MRVTAALSVRGRVTLIDAAGVRLEQDGAVVRVVWSAPDIAPLNGILQWAALAEEVVNVRQHGDEVESDREETRAKFQKYFAESGMRGFYAVPLNDDTGRVGILSLESSDPDFLTQVHIELLDVLASQATAIAGSPSAAAPAAVYRTSPFFSRMPRDIVVGKKPGQMAFTLMLYYPHSAASVRVK